MGAMRPTNRVKPPAGGARWCPSAVPRAPAAAYAGR